MAILDRGTSAVKPEEQFEMFEIYLKKAADYFGVTHTREIYQKAIDVLPDEGTKIMCLRFAELETKLGEIDRARAIYAHCSQICDPRVAVEFWNSWKNFEVKHGNEDTLREMLRIKRSVQATYNTKVNYITSQMMDKANSGGSNVGDLVTGENNNEVPVGKGQDQVNASLDSETAPKENILFVRSSTTDAQMFAKEVVNPNELDLESDEETENNDNFGDEFGSESKADDVELVKRNVPASVFGSLLTNQNESSKTEQ